MAWLSLGREPPDTAHNVGPVDSMSASAMARSSMSAPVSAQTCVFGSSVKMPRRCEVGPNRAPHQRPSAYHSFDWAVLVVGERTTVGSTTKSWNVIPAGGGASTGAPLLGAVGGGDPDGGVGDGAGGRANVITAKIDMPTTMASPASATQGRRIPFVGDSFP